MKVTLEIDGKGDEREFTRDMVEMANGDPDWRVKVTDLSE